MRTTTGTLVLSTLIVLGAPSGAAAQDAGSAAAADFWRWALEGVRQDREVGAPVRAAQGRRGPAFCRSGLGHPVHGRAWCLRKGFGLGAVPWVRIGLDGVRVGATERPRRFDGRLGSRDLAAILGEDVLRRLLEEAGRDASVSFLNGRWQDGVAGPGARVLQIRVVDRPLAEINDLDADGRAEAVLLYRP